MPNFLSLGGVLILLGLILVIIGVLMILGPSVPWLGRLPGDISIERGRFRFYFPIVTCLVLSLALTLLISVIRYFSR